MLFYGVGQPPAPVSKRPGAGGCPPDKAARAAKEGPRMARTTVADLLDQRAGQQPDKLLVACAEDRRTYRQAAHTAARPARGLAGTRVGPRARGALAGSDHLPRSVPADLAAIVYTSGTTGPSKGCMINQGYYVHVGAGMAAALELRADDVYLTAFPLFHLSGQALALMATLQQGATVVFEPVFSASTFMERAGAGGATVGMV